jgi:predicted transcriptional regulator
MNNNKEVLRTVKEIPEEIRHVIKGLDNDTRLAILTLLMKNGKMTYSELKNSLSLNSSTLSADLSLLQDGGLVANFLEWKNKSYSYYVITNLAKSVLKSLFDAVVKLPDQAKKEYIIGAQNIDRSRLEIIASILDATKTGQQKKKILYKSFLTIEKLSVYLESLEGIGQLEYNEKTSLYKTTEKGLIFLDQYRQLLGLVRKVDALEVKLDAKTDQTSSG